MRPLKEWDPVIGPQLNLLWFQRDYIVLLKRTAGDRCCYQAIAQACAFRSPCSRSMHYERAPCFRRLKQMVWRGLRAAAL